MHGGQVYFVLSDPRWKRRRQRTWQWHSQGVRQTQVTEIGSSRPPHRRPRRTQTITAVYAVHGSYRHTAHCTDHLGWKRVSRKRIYTKNATRRLTHVRVHSSERRLNETLKRRRNMAWRVVSTRGLGRHTKQAARSICQTI